MDRRSLLVGLTATAVGSISYTVTRRTLSTAAEPQASAGYLSAVVTPSGLATAMSPVSMPAFATYNATGARVVTVDPTVTYQTFLGVGAAVTDAAAYNLMVRQNPEQRAAILQEMFGLNGWSAVRVPMGASDFSFVSPYTYDDAGTDLSLSTFSVANSPDSGRVIPVLKQILAINPAVRIIASPWTGPARIKANNSLLGGAFVVNAANQAYWAAYIVKYVKEMAALGIPVWGITTQNEPDVSREYPGMTWTGIAMSVFIRDYLGPAFTAAGLTTNIITGDSNWSNTPDFVSDSLSDAGARAYVSHIAYHGYAASPSAQSGTVTTYPNVGVLFTEMRTLQSESLDTAQAIMAGDVAVGGIRNWSQMITLWNMALDESGFPTQGSPGRRGVVTINSATGAVTRNPEYYMLSHIGKYVKVGAKRCDCNSFAVGKAGTDIEAVSFINTDGTIVVFLWNGASADKVVTLADAGSGLGTTFTLAARAMATVTYTPPPASPVVVTAPAAGIQTMPTRALGQHK